MDVKKLGETIRYLRIRNGYTQQDIAECLQISYQAVSKWERGLCVPDAMYLPGLAEKLDVELEDLLHGNIKFLNEEWEGVLDLSNAVWEKRLEDDREELAQIYPILLSYFVLAGIRDITISSNLRELHFIDSIYKDGNKYGLRLRYMASGSVKNKSKTGIMYVYDLIFLYGSNLTRYFWRCMDCKDGISTLTKQKSNAGGV